MAEREGKGKYLEAYKKLNIGTGILALTLIGGSIGLAMALFDASQVYTINWVQKRQKKK